jgi:hypothetical protein
MIADLAIPTEVENTPNLADDPDIAFLFFESAILVPPPMLEI